MGITSRLRVIKRFDRSMKIRPTFILIFVSTLFIACQDNSPEHEWSPSPYADITSEIEAAVWAFHAADTARNAEAIIDLLWPESTMLIDGQRSTYQDIVKGSKQFMNELVLFHTEWTDLEIIPVAENAAISSFIFQDSIIHHSGALTQAKGPNTFLWQKRKGEWRILFVDADHYPVNLDH